MNYKNSIRFKASLLLLVFSLNTVVGFACAMGWNIGFAMAHHKDEIVKPPVHIHPDGKKHLHRPEPVKAKVHIHADGKQHHHQKAPAQSSVQVEAEVQKQENKSEPVNEQVKAESPKKEKDDCCNDEVLKFQNLDKSLNQNAKITIDAPVFIAILRIFSGIDIVSLSKAYPPKYKDRFFYPPPPDIRIAIQSFQI